MVEVIGNIHISIRAPARGATTMHSQVSRPSRFQFAPPRGGRRIVDVELLAAN